MTWCPSIRILHRPDRTRNPFPVRVVTDVSRLNLEGGVGTRGEISGSTVRIVGLTKNFKGLAGPYVFCSLSTARL